MKYFLKNIINLTKIPASTLSKFIGVFVFTSGSVNIVSSFFFVVPENFDLLTQFIPLEIINASRTTTLIAGVFLLYLSYGLFARKYRAWLISIILLSLSFLTNILKGLDIGESIFLVIPLSVLVYFRKIYSVSSGQKETLGRVRLSLFIFLGLFLYEIFGFYLLQGQFTKTVSLARIIATYLSLFNNSQVSYLVPNTLLASWFTGSLGFIGIGGITMALGALFVPLQRDTKPTDEEYNLARNLVKKYGSNSSSYLSLMKDKSFFFSTDKSCLIAYKIEQGMAIAIGDPIGPQTMHQSMVKAFYESMHQHGLSIAFANASGDEIAQYKQNEMKVVQIGEEAILDTASFSLSGSSMADIRHSVNRMQREQVRFQWYNLSEISWNILSQIEKLHTSWINNRNIVPLTFSVDYYPLPVEKDAYILCVLSSTDKLIGAFSYLPYNNSKGVIVELMLRGNQAPNGMVEAAFVESIRYFKEKGIDEVNLGGAPLAITKPTQEQSVLSNSLGYIFSHVTTLYGFKSLYNFKQKFSPTWKPKYLVYESSLALPKTALALLQVHLTKSLSKSFLATLRK